MSQFFYFRVSKSFIGFVLVILCIAFASCKSDVGEVQPREVGQLSEVDSDTAAISFSSMVSSANAKIAAYACQCVDYIRNRFPLLSSYRGNAKAWHSNLISAGYKVASNPVAGDVIVFQPSFGGVDGTNGHIAAVVSYSYSYDAKTKVGTRKLTHRGANTGGSETECNCTNVKSSTVTYTDGKVGYIAYYHK